MASINIIVPIFNQRDLLEQCVSSVLSAHSETKHHLTLIDDASTDVGMHELLSDLSKNPKVDYLRNSHNLGFTKTANIGLQLHRTWHPLLLNSDTVVYDNWLDAMLETLTEHPKVASVNPMTNQNGSHISCYPFQFWAEPDPLILSHRDFAKIAYEACGKLSCEVHTTVGFCMLLNRRCLDEVGKFDPVWFPRGYGEESDFCYRSRHLGWKHYIAAGAFVTHLHVKSFGREKERLKKSMLPNFRRLHPTQPVRDREFCETDPLRLIRGKLDLARCKSRLAGLSEMAVAHADADNVPYLKIDTQQSNDVFLSDPIDDLGFPNIGPYTLPDQIIELVYDLASIGIRSLQFPAGYAPAIRCAELVRLIYSPVELACRISNYKLVFSGSLLESQLNLDKL
ncbi:MAG: glycosyltransferase [Hyphomicrobiaceae bacterium]